MNIDQYYLFNEDPIMLQQCGVFDFVCHGKKLLAAAKKVAAQAALKAKQAQEAALKNEYYCTIHAGGPYDYKPVAAYSIGDQACANSCSGSCRREGSYTRCTSPWSSYKYYHCKLMPEKSLAKAKQAAEAAAKKAKEEADAIAKKLQLDKLAREAEKAAEALRLKQLAEKAANEMKKVGDDAAKTIKEVGQKAETIATEVKDTLESEAKGLWTDLQAALGLNKDALYNKWRGQLNNEFAFSVAGDVYANIEDVKPATKSITSGTVDLEFSRIKPLIELLNEEVLIDKSRKSGIKGIPGFTGIPIPSFGKKNIQTWKLSCPTGHILVPKLKGSHVKSPKGFYEELDKIYNISNECGISYKQNDEAPKSLLGKGGAAVAKAVVTGAKIAGLTNLVFADGTKQCCRQHRMCLLGYGDAMEDIWVSGKQEIDGIACEQQYWECLGSCALMGNLQTEIADIFGFQNLKGGCPTESDITESGGAAGHWTDAVGKSAKLVAKKAGKKYVKNKILQKAGAKKYLKTLKEYKKAKKAGKDLSKFSKKTLKTGKAIKFVSKATSMIPKLVKEIAVAPALSFSSHETTKDLPIHENWMCVPDPMNLSEVEDEPMCSSFSEVNSGPSGLWESTGYFPGRGGSTKNRCNDGNTHDGYEYKYNAGRLNGNSLCGNAWCCKKKISPMTESECKRYQQEKYPNSTFINMDNKHRVSGCVKITYRGRLNGIAYNTGKNSDNCGSTYRGYKYDCIKCVL